MRFKLHSAARAEFLEAISRYEEAVPGLGGRFLVEFERSIRLLPNAPTIGVPFGSRLRRFVLNDHFPYSIVYAVRDDLIVVVAVAHGLRRPGYWMRRRA